MHHPNRVFGRSLASGQTLVELSIAVLILAITAMLGLPALGDVLSRQTIASAASSWRNAQAIARSHAIMRRLPVAICPSSDGETCEPQVSWQAGFIVFEDPDRNRLRGAAEPLLRVFAGQPRLRMTSSIGRRVIVFQSSGRPDGSNVTMTICDPQRPGASGRRLITSNSGRTRSEAADCAD